MALVKPVDSSAFAVSDLAEDGCGAQHAVNTGAVIPTVQMISQSCVAHKPVHSVS